VPNRLAGATSPYLLQHADNPVDWHPWGPEALARARREARPILLSIGFTVYFFLKLQTARRELGMGD